MEVILKWCSKSVFIYDKVTKKTKARFLFSLLLCGLFFLQAALYLILTIQLPLFGNLKTFILLGYKVFTTFVVEPFLEMTEIYGIKSTTSLSNNIPFSKSFIHK